MALVNFHDMEKYVPVYKQSPLQKTSACLFVFGMNDMKSSRELVTKNVYPKLRRFYFHKYMKDSMNLRGKVGGELNWGLSVGKSAFEPIFNQALFIRHPNGGMFRGVKLDLQRRGRQMRNSDPKIQMADRRG